MKPTTAKYSDGHSAKFDAKDMHTDWGAPEHIIASEFGLVPEWEWCELESARCAAMGSTVHVVTRETDGYVALTKKML